EWRTATPWPDRTACLRRDDGLGWCAKSPAAMPAWDNLRFGLSPIDSDIFARGKSLDLQRDALGRAGCERVYDDVCSGRATERPGLAKALDAARKGDALVVWKLDRIGRSLAHVVGLVGNLQKHGIGLKVLTGDVDTTTATGRLVFGIF